MTEKLPDDNENLDTSLPEANFSESEIDILLNANPGDVGLEELMAAHGMNFDEKVLIHVEGRPDAIYTTNTEDFMTRDKAATIEWNSSVDAAQGILNLEELETEIDEHSSAMEAEAIEHGAEAISVEEAQKIGEPPVEIAGIVDPSDTLAKSVFEKASTDIQREAATGLRITAKGLSENANSFQTSERVFLDGIGDSTNRLEAVLRNYENYPAHSIQAEINATLEALHSPMRAGLSVSEQNLNEIKRYADFAEKTLAEQAQFASNADENFRAALNGKTSEDVVPATTAIESAQVTIAGISELSAALNTVDTATQAILSSLRSNFSHLEDILRQSYSRPVNVDELMGVVVQLKQLSLEDNAHNAFRSAHTSVNMLLDQVKLAVDQLEPPSA
jgi:hypothetical protein